MKTRFSTSMTLTGEELHKVESLKKSGWKIIDIFRAGLRSVSSGSSLKQAVDSEQIPPESDFPKVNPMDFHGCGCEKVPGKVLCKTHGRV